MLRSTLSKVAWVGRTASMVFGLALVLALILGLASAALSATGGGLMLGKANEATTVTRLTASLAGPALTLVNQGTDAAATALSIHVGTGKAPLRVNAAAGTATNLSADELDGKDSSGFYARGAKVSDSSHADRADSAASATSAADADLLDGRDSSEFQASNPCPADTMFHEGACIEIAERGTRGFPNAEAGCLQDGRRLPTVAELQTFRLREGQDFDAAEYTSHTWVDDAGRTRTMMVTPSGTQTPATFNAAFRCVAAPSTVAPNPAWEAAAKSDLRNAATAATACAADHAGSYVECGTAAQLLPYGFEQSPDVTYANLMATATRWVSATQHDDGISAYQFDSATGEITPVPRC